MKCLIVSASYKETPSIKLQVSSFTHSKIQRRVASPFNTLSKNTCKNCVIYIKKYIYFGLISLWESEIYLPNCLWILSHCFCISSRVVFVSDATAGACKEVVTRPMPLSPNFSTSSESVSCARPIQFLMQFGLPYIGGHLPF